MLRGKEGETRNLDDLKSLIIRHIGGQEKTITQALHVMGNAGLIKDIGNYRFIIQNAK